MLVFIFHSFSYWFCFPTSLWVLRVRVRLQRSVLLAFSVVIIWVTSHYSSLMVIDIVCVNLYLSLSCQTLSKAFDTSLVTTLMIFLLACIWLMNSDTSALTSWQLLLFQKPNCLSFSRLCSSRCPYVFEKRDWSVVARICHISFSYWYKYHFSF